MLSGKFSWKRAGLGLLAGLGILGGVACTPLPTNTPKPIATPTATAVAYECRNITDREKNVIVNYFNGSDKVYSLYWDTEANYWLQQKKKPQISISDIIGGFAYGNELIFAVITPQLKSHRAEFVVIKDEQEIYRSGGIYAPGARGISESGNCQKITLDLDIAGKYVFVRQKDGTYK